jgi:hypothetical protein
MKQNGLVTHHGRHTVLVLVDRPARQEVVHKRAQREEAGGLDGREVAQQVEGAHVVLLLERVDVLRRGGVKASR